MADRENVIKALEICAVGINSCEKCPLKDKCHGVSNAAMVAAIELLKEQEPVKPIRLENWWECPSCNGNIVANMKYCPNCGRAVKWDETD